MNPLSSEVLSFSMLGVLALLAVPFLTMLVLALLGKQQAAWVTGVAIGGSGLSFLLALMSLYGAWEQAIYTRTTWLSLVGVGTWQMGLYIDRLAALMTVLITGVSMLIHVYSITYMAEDKPLNRYWISLQLFVGAMLLIVLADNFLLIFTGWELVGLSSYLLIGYYRGQAVAGPAAQKAFLINRIGDAAFLGGMLLLFWEAGTWEWTKLAEATQGGKPLSSVQEAFSERIYWAFLLIGGGAIGKSAQFPLQVWLPDAMAGPTPVSALIHAATMVAAGVYLLGRIIFFLPPDYQAVFAIIGGITAILSAVAACAQWDIKKVLAYSTLSQLGYMFMGMGVGARDMALFHLFTHAFFKAGLFLIAGVIIHQRHHLPSLQKEVPAANDIRLMGGLGRAMPWAFRMYLLCAAALVGLPFTAGFLSKDGILMAAWQWAEMGDGWAFLIPVLGMLTVALTAAYMMRLTRWVFGGSPRQGEEYKQMKDPEVRMWGPIAVLTLGCIWFWWSLSPFGAEESWFIRAIHLPGIGDTHEALTWVPIVSVSLLVVGLFGGYRGYRWQAPKALFQLAAQHIYLDTLYTWIGKTVLRLARGLSWVDRKGIDGLVHLVAAFFVANQQRSLVHRLSHFDEEGLDQSIDRVAQLTVTSNPNRLSLARVSTLVDDGLIDGLVNRLVRGIGRLGQSLQSWQNGQVQGYLIGALLLLFMVVGLLVWVFIGA